MTVCSGTEERSFTASSLLAAVGRKQQDGIARLLRLPSLLTAMAML
jgi:hypothetical protein